MNSILRIDSEKFLSDPTLVAQFGHQKLEQILGIFKEWQTTEEPEALENELDITKKKRKMNVRNRLVRKKIHKLKKLESLFDEKCKLVKDLIGHIEQEESEGNENLLNELKSFVEAQEKLREEFSHPKSFGTQKSEDYHEMNDEDSDNEQDHEEGSSLYEQWKREFDLLKMEMEKIVHDRDELTDNVSSEKNRYDELETKYFEFEQKSIGQQESLIHEIEGLKSVRCELEKHIDLLKQEVSSLEERDSLRKEHINELEDQLAKLKEHREIIEKSSENVEVKTSASGGVHEGDKFKEKTLMKWFNEAKKENKELQDQLNEREALIRELARVKEEKAGVEAAFNLFKMEYDTQMISMQVLKPELEEFYEILCIEIAERHKLPFTDFVSKEEFIGGLKHLKDEFKIATNRMIDMRILNQELSKKLQLSNEALGGIMVELNEAKVKLVEVQKERERLAAELLLAQSQLDLARETYAREKALIVQQAQCIEKMGLEIRALTENIDAVKMELARTMESLSYKEKLSQELLESEEKNKEYRITLEERVEHFKGALGELEADFRQKEREMSVLKDDVAILEVKVKELEKDIEIKDLEIQKLSEQEKENQGTISNNETMIIGLRTRNEDHIKQIGTLELEKSTLESQLRESVLYCAELKSQVQDSFEKIKTLEDLIDQERQFISGKMKEYQILLQKYKELQNEMGELKIEISKTTEKKVDLEQIIENTKDSLKDFQSQFEESRQLSNRMQKALGDLESNLDTLDKAPIKRKTTVTSTVIKPTKDNDVPIEIEVAKLAKTQSCILPESKPKALNYNFSWNEHIQLQQMLKETAKKFDKNSNNKVLDKWRTSNETQEKKVKPIIPEEKEIITEKILDKKEKLGQENSIIRLD